jgi:membrane-anchored protein YejM (alkaline phosphatase superfamily)
MELPVQSSPQPSRGRNLEAAPWCYLLWGVPAVLVVAAGIAYGESVISLTARGVIWVTAVAWAGVGCLINGQSCGRVHCRIDGIALPLLAIAGASNVLSVISFDWNLFWLAFFVILLVSFVPEWTWRKYS